MITSTTANAFPRSRKTSIVMCHSPSHFIAYFVESNGWRFQRGLQKASYARLPAGAAPLEEFEKVLGATEAAKLVQVEHLIMALIDGIHFFKTNKVDTIKIVKKHCSQLLKMQNDEEWNCFYDNQAESLEGAPYPSIAAIQNVFALALKRNPEIKRDEYEFVNARARSLPSMGKKAKCPMRSSPGI
mgnify:CR=1 FL=1